MAPWQIAPVGCKIRYRPLTLTGGPADYLHILAGARKPFFLDSAAQHSQWGRFSYIGANPLFSLTFTTPGPMLLDFDPDFSSQGQTRQLARNP